MGTTRYRKIKWLGQWLRKWQKGYHTPHRPFALQSSGMEGSVVPPLPAPTPQSVTIPCNFIKVTYAGEDKRKGWVTDSKNEQSLNLGPELEIWGCMERRGHAEGDRNKAWKERLNEQEDLRHNQAKCSTETSGRSLPLPLPCPEAPCSSWRVHCLALALRAITVWREVTGIRREQEVQQVPQHSPQAVQLHRPG